MEEFARYPAHKEIVPSKDGKSAFPRKTPPHKYEKHNRLSVVDHGLSVCRVRRQSVIEEDQDPEQIRSTQAEISTRVIQGVCCTPWRYLLLCNS